MKTPEELAIRYSDLREFADRRLDYKAKMLLEQGFLAGYQAAKAFYETRIEELETLLENAEMLATHGQEGL